jgi:hypothetical protein
MNYGSWRLMDVERTHRQPMLLKEQRTLLLLLLLLLLISCFHHASLLSVTFINQLMHSIITAVDVRIYGI